MIPKKQLDKAFKALRKHGYYAKQNYWCCQSCGVADIPDDVEKYVFYHQQDNDSRWRGKDFHVTWSGDGKEICNILKENGIETEWNGSEATRILIKNK